MKESMIVTAICAYLQLQENLQEYLDLFLDRNF